MSKMISTGALLMASLEGQTLGQYKVIAQMGSGGMATVYKAYQERLDRFVAIKMLHEAFQEDQNFLARFEREAKIVARLEHPHIVQVFDFDDYNGRPYLVMKFVEGKTLKAELEDMPLTVDEILRIMPPIADALDYAHGQGVLHRDIKPSNIIVDQHGTPYLTDFGLARMAQVGDSTLSSDVLLGTPHYISPEQAMGNRDLDARTDLYSLGVVLYELVVGRVPFSADTPFAVIHDQIYRPLPKPSSINPELTPAVDAVLEKALAKSPSDRYSTATEMVDAFRRAITTSGVTTLNPDRSSIASESLAKLRDQEAPPAESIPAPAAPEKPKVQTEQPGFQMRGFAPPGGFSMPTSRHEVKQAQREARRYAKREARRVVEAEFDFSDAGKAIQSAGAAVRGAMEGIGEAFENSGYDPDLVPMDDGEAIRRRMTEQYNKRREFMGDIVSFVLVNALLWVIYSATNFLGFPWPLIVTLGWGSGLAAHAIETYYATGSRARHRLQVIQRAFYQTYGEDWVNADKKELRRIRQQVTEPLTKRREFADHLAVFVLINLMLWFIYGVTNFLGFPWPLIVTLGWGIGLVAHGAEVLSNSSRESAIDRAVEQERDRLSLSEKPKRDRFADSREVHLTEDGEFTDSMIEEIDAEEKAKRDRR